jgi:hypothetical protein
MAHRQDIMVVPVHPYATEMLLHLIINYTSIVSFFFRNGVFPASASIDAHSHFIKNV